MTDDLPPSTPASSSLPGQVPRHEDDFFRSPSVALGFLRICLYLVLFNFIDYVVQSLAGIFTRRVVSPFAPPRLLASELALCAGAFGAAWIMSRVERRAPGDYGLPLRGALGKLFWLGALFGLVEISAVLGAMAVLGSYHFGSVLLNGLPLFRWLIFWAAFFLLVGLYEEFAFRGYVQFTLSQGLGFWPAAILLSLAFGAVHTRNPGESWPGIAGIVLTGLFWCFTLQRTGTLWFAVGMHASFDFGETFLYSVPDSGIVFPGHLSSATLAGPAWLTGGSAGPEASVFDFLVLLLFLYAVHRLFPRPSTAGPRLATDGVESRGNL